MKGLKTLKIKSRYECKNMCSPQEKRLATPSACRAHRSKKRRKLHIQPETVIVVVKLILKLSKRSLKAQHKIKRKAREIFKKKPPIYFQLNREAEKNREACVFEGKRNIPEVYFPHTLFRRRYS